MQSIYHSDAVFVCYKCCCFFHLNGMCSGACSQIRVSNTRFLLAFPVALLYVLITISLDAPFIFLIASPH